VTFVRQSGRKAPRHLSQVLILSANFDIIKYNPDMKAARVDSLLL
jgi:hypothetical protein